MNNSPNHHSQELKDTKSELEVDKDARDDEFYDATDRLEKLELNIPNDHDIDAQSIELINPKGDSKVTFGIQISILSIHLTAILICSQSVPLHEQLNSQLKEKQSLEAANESDDESEKPTNFVNDEDFYFVDEAKLKEDEDKLTEDEKQVISLYDTIIIYEVIISQDLQLG